MRRGEPYFSPPHRYTFAQHDTIVFARPLAGRGKPEDWSTNDYTSRSDFYCGVNVPDETGKMSRSDKRGATLPKVATVVSLAMTCCKKKPKCEIFYRISALIVFQICS